MARGFSTCTQVRVRYADTDQMRFVYHAKYLEYFEQGRSDLLRELGIPYPAIEAKGFYLPVIEAHARYIRSARYDDLLEVRTIVNEEPGVRIKLAYEIRRQGEADVLVEGYTIHSFVRAGSGRPSRPPQEIVDVFHEKLKNG